MDDDGFVYPPEPMLIDPTIALQGNVNIPNLDSKDQIEFLGYIESALEWETIRQHAGVANNSKTLCKLLQEIAYQVRCRVKHGAASPQAVVMDRGIPDRPIGRETIVTRVSVPADALKLALMSQLAGKIIDTNSAKDLLELVGCVVSDVEKSLNASEED